jgi:hypothetical protein
MYLGVWESIAEEFHRHYEETVMTNIGMDSPIDEIFDLLDKMDRFSEFLSVIDRSELKLSDRKTKVKPGSKVIENPLSRIKIILDSRKGRPDWTFNALQPDRLQETADSRSSVLPPGFKFF